MFCVVPASACAPNHPSVTAVTAVTQVHEFLVNIAVCNTVVPTIDPATGQVQYQVRAGHLILSSSLSLSHSIDAARDIRDLCNRELHAPHPS
jgi:hypothetical protein